MFPGIKYQTLELVKESMLVFLFSRTVADPSLIPAWSLRKAQQGSRKHKFSILNWFRNDILQPIKHTKTSVFHFLVEFCSGIRLGSATVCHHRTTSKLSFTSSKVWSLCPTSSGTNSRWCYIEVHPCCLFLLQARNTPLHLAAASGLLSCVEVGTCMQVGLQYHSWIQY